MKFVHIYFEKLNELPVITNFLAIFRFSVKLTNQGQAKLRDL